MAMQRWMMFTTALMLSACDTGGGAGAELTVRTWGEEYIEEGIPADVFNDQWSVRYNRFLINLGTVEVGEVGAAPALEQPKFQIYDLAKASKGEGQLVVAGEVPSGTYANTQYKIYPADGSSVVGNAGDADAKMMQDSGYSVFVSGTASKGDVEKTFVWGFKTSTSYEGCESSTSSMRCPSTFIDVPSAASPTWTNALRCRV